MIVKKLSEKLITSIVTANVYLALIMPRHYSRHFPCIISLIIYEVGTIIIPIFQTRKVKHREVKQLAPDLYLGNSKAPEPEHFITILQEDEGDTDRHGTV